MEVWQQGGRDEVRGREQEVVEIQQAGEQGQQGQVWQVRGQVQDGDEGPGQGQWGQGQDGRGGYYPHAGERQRGIGGLGSRRQRGSQYE